MSSKKTVTYPAFIPIDEENGRWIGIEEATEEQIRTAIKIYEHQAREFTDPIRDLRKGLREGYLPIK